MELFDAHSKPSERRSFLRKKCLIPVMGLGTIRDIGLGGLYLETPNIPTGHDISVVFNLDTDKPIIASAEVANRREMRDRRGCGLRFVNIDVNSRVHILNYVNERTRHSPIEDDVRASLDSFVKNWPNQYGMVSSQFKKEIADFRLHLTQLKLTLNREEGKLAVLPPAERVKACETIIEFYEKILQDKVHSMLLAINEVIKDFTDTEHALHRSYYREQLLDFTNESAFCHRALDKPLGYAGDYVMMELLYHGLRFGKTLWQRVINSCFTSMPLAQAVRNRAWYLLDQIARTVDVKKHPNIMSLACGPCEEVAMALENRYPSASYFLVDQDPEALQYAQGKLSKVQFTAKSSAAFSYRADSVKDFLKKPDIDGEYPPMDLIYTAGLYDYLTDSVATKLTRTLWSILRPGGKLIIGNFTFSDFGYFIEYACNWFLKYRTREQLLQTVPDDIVVQETKIDTEPSGVNLFLCLTKA